MCLQYLLAQNIRLRTVKAARPDRAREKEAGVGEGIGGGCPEREIVGVRGVSGRQVGKRLWCF